MYLHNNKSASLTTCSYTGVSVCAFPCGYARSTVCGQCVCLGRLEPACRLPNRIIKSIIASHASGSVFPFHYPSYGPHAHFSYRRRHMLQIHCDDVVGMLQLIVWDCLQWAFSGILEMYFVRLFLRKKQRWKLILSTFGEWKWQYIVIRLRIFGSFR